MIRRLLYMQRKIISKGGEGGIQDVILINLEEKIDLSRQEMQFI